MILHVLWWPPYGADTISEPNVKPLLASGIIERTTPEENAAASPGNFLARISKSGHALYRLGSDYDRADYDLACRTLYCRRQADKRQRVLDALDGLDD
jgi:hypothetical protein